MCGVKDCSCHLKRAAGFELELATTSPTRPFCGQWPAVLSGDSFTSRAQGWKGQSLGGNFLLCLGHAQADFPHRSWCEKVRLCPSEDGKIRRVGTRLTTPGLHPEGQLAGQRLLLGATAVSWGSPGCCSRRTWEPFAELVSWSQLQLIIIRHCRELLQHVTSVTIYYSRVATICGDFLSFY